MRLYESKISDVAVDAGEHLGLYDKENQTLTRSVIVKHLKDVHGLTHKRDIAFVIDAMKTSFPKMKIKEGEVNEDAGTVRLSTLIVMIKDTIIKGNARDPKKVKDLLKQLERFLKEKGDKDIPKKELLQIMKMTEGQTIDGGVGDHLNPEDVDENELLVGIEVEYEHAKGDKIAALDIALDHLKEDPKYYTKLVKSGIVDEPKAIELAKKKLDIEERYYIGKLKKVEYEVISETKIRDFIREEIQGLLKEDPNLWAYIYNFGNTYIPKKQGK